MPRCKKQRLETVSNSALQHQITHFGIYLFKKIHNLETPTKASMKRMEKKLDDYDDVNSQVSREQYRRRSLTLHKYDQFTIRVRKTVLWSVLGSK